MYNHITTIRLTPKLRNWIRGYAKANEMKASNVIRLAVKQFAESQKSIKLNQRSQAK